MKKSSTREKSKSIWESFASENWTNLLFIIPFIAFFLLLEIFQLTRFQFHIFLLVLNLITCFIARFKVIWKATLIILPIAFIFFASYILPPPHALFSPLYIYYAIFIIFNLILIVVTYSISVNKSELFRSVKLAIVLIIILAVASIAGTLIPQDDSIIGFARDVSPQEFQLFSLLRPFDIYHSLWFRLLIECLALNLIVCSVGRFPSSWNQLRALPRPDRSKIFEHLPSQQSCTIKGEAKDAANRVNQFLKGRYKKIQKKDVGDSYFFYTEKGSYAHFGVYLVHLSVLVILIGALIGSFSGFDAYVEIQEGQQVDTVTLRKSDVQMKLGYEVRCDKFFVDFYENGSPREFRSDLAFMHDGKEVEIRSLRVNHPVKFGGITFYQSSYGKVPGERVRVRISRPQSEQEFTNLDVEVGKSFSLPGSEAQFRLAKANMNFMQLGPAVLISARSTQGEETRFWVFQHSERIKKQFPGLLDQYPKLNPSAFTPYTFYLDAIESRYYTGLQVKKDPGVPVVWLGYVLMVAGLIVTFFTFHRRMWVRVSKREQGVNVSVAGKAAKNPVGLERELKHLTTQLRNLFNETR